MNIDLETKDKIIADYRKVGSLVEISEKYGLKGGELRDLISEVRGKYLITKRFTSGNLKGMEIEETYNFKPKVGKVTGYSSSNYNIVKVVKLDNN